MSSKHERFVRDVWKRYRQHGRHTLPWRQTKNPYRILVSEIMLQQTQVERVLPYYKAWIRRFKNVDALARAPLKEVLTLWQGLGYNRRAKNLHLAAKELVQLPAFPKTAEELECLSGVGPYTARAVLAFAYNTPVVMVETNIRTAVLHHFFSARNTNVRNSVSDAEIEKVLEKVLPKGKSREWYYALMDYGSYLKHSGVRLNKNVKGYAKQTTFSGSDREARGAIIKALAQKTHTEEKLLLVLGKKRKSQMRVQLHALLREGMVIQKRGRYSLPA